MHSIKTCFCFFTRLGGFSIEITFVAKCTPMKTRTHNICTTMRSHRMPTYKTGNPMTEFKRIKCNKLELLSNLTGEFVCFCYKRLKFDNVLSFLLNCTRIIPRVICFYAHDFDLLWNCTHDMFMFTRIWRTATYVLFCWRINANIQTFLRFQLNLSVKWNCMQAFVEHISFLLPTFYLKKNPLLRPTHCKFDMFMVLSLPIRNGMKIWNKNFLLHTCNANVWWKNRE